MHVQLGIAICHYLSLIRSQYWAKEWLWRLDNTTASWWNLRKYQTTVTNQKVILVNTGKRVGPLTRYFATGHRTPWKTYLHVPKCEMIFLYKPWLLLATQSKLHCPARPEDNAQPQSLENLPWRVSQSGYSSRELPNASQRCILAKVSARWEGVTPW